MDKKSDLWGLVVELKRIILGAFITIILVVAAFVVYLILSNDSSSINTTGMYNLVNSKTGEIITTDLTAEDIEKIMELLDGDDKVN